MTQDEALAWLRSEEPLLRWDKTHGKRLRSLCREATGTSDFGAASASIRRAAVLTMKRTWGEPMDEAEYLARKRRPLEPRGSRRSDRQSGATTGKMRPAAGKPGPAASKKRPRASRARAAIRQRALEWLEPAFPEVVWSDKHVDAILAEAAPESWGRLDQNSRVGVVAGYLARTPVRRKPDDPSWKCVHGMPVRRCHYCLR